MAGVRPNDAAAPRQYLAEVESKIEASSEAATAAIDALKVELSAHASTVA
eukprot:COSAG02_NODE_4476_length_5322_cov_34.435573_1_plen_49_part_10